MCISNDDSDVAYYTQQILFKKRNCRVDSLYYNRLTDWVNRIFFTSGNMGVCLWCTMNPEGGGVGFLVGSLMSFSLIFYYFKCMPNKLAIRCMHSCKAHCTEIQIRGMGD